VPQRIVGIIGSANTSAMFSVIVILLIISWIIYMPEKNKFYINILLFFSIINLILMFSRNALMSLILAGAFLLSMAKLNKVVMKLLLSIILLMVFASFINLEQLFGPAYAFIRGFRLSEIFYDSGVNESVISGRFYHWKMGFLKYMLSPVFGWGLSIGDNMLNESWGLTETIRGFYAPHSEYIDLLLTTGIIGLAIYLLFFITIYKKASMLSKNKTDCFSVFLGRSVQAIIIALAIFSFADGFWFSAFVPALLMLLFGAMYAVDKRQKLLFKYKLFKGDEREV
jgi:O-antigen ligase